MRPGAEGAPSCIADENHYHQFRPRHGTAAMFAQPVLLRPRTLHLPQRPAPRPLAVDDAIDSGALLKGQREILIRHGDRVYRLRHTSNDKLILTK